METSCNTTDEIRAICEKKWPSSMVEEIKESGRPLVVSWSGGKDSTAVAIWLRFMGVHLTNPIYYVYCDTGWEHPLLYKYVDDMEKNFFDGDLHRLQSKTYAGYTDEKTGEEIPGGMLSMVLQRGMFANRMQRMCTKELKILPMRDFVREIAEKYGPDARPYNVVGIRAAESKARSQLLEFEPGTILERSQKRKDMCDTWRPGISWDVSDVVELHTLAGIKPCELYLLDEHPSQRVGCYPCILSRKSEIRAVAETWPERIVQIRSLEERVTAKAEERYAKKGETLESRGYEALSFFASKDYHRTGQVMQPIDEVVKWAKTDTGGQQYSLFGLKVGPKDEPFLPADPSERGCQMWGLCDIPAEDGQ